MEKMANVIAALAFLTVLILLGAIIVASSGRYELTTGSAQQVWRIDRFTGRVSVCDSSGPDLLCRNVKENR